MQYTMGEVIENAATLPWDWWIFFGESPVDWTLETRCKVLSADEEPDDEVPASARNVGLLRMVPVAALQDVIENLRLRSLAVDSRSVLAAFAYYTTNDAFPPEQ